MNYSWYITPEEYEIAKNNGICRNTLEKRIRWYGWDKERAISTPVRLKRKYPIEIKKLANENGLTFNCVKYRVCKLGWDIQKAATEPQMSFRMRGLKGSITKGTKYPIEYLKLAEQNGISHRRFRDRVSRLKWSMEKAATTPIMSRQQATRNASKAYFNYYGHNFGYYQKGRKGS